MLVFLLLAEAAGSTSPSRSLAAVSSSSGSATCSSSSASSRRLGSGAPWYCEDWERDFLEGVSAGVMMLIALAFEQIHHRLHHEAEHGFVYGRSMMTDEDKQHRVRAALFGEPLRLMLLTRVGGEFMVLGFLAFTIWTCNQRGLFDALADMGDTGIRLPTAGEDYLHLMEEVHIQLSVAMMLYFFLALLLVIAVDRRIRQYEKDRAVWIDQILHSKANNLDTDERSLRTFKYWRGHFLEGCVSEILAWRTKNAETFAQVMKNLKVEKKLDSITKPDLLECFTGRFSFCSYLVFSLVKSTQEMVEMCPATLFTIISIKGLISILNRFAHVKSDMITSVLNGLCFVILSFIYFSTRALERRLQIPQNEQGDKLFGWRLIVIINRFSRHIDPEKFLLRTLQVLLFFMCHTWSGNMINKLFWSDIFQRGKMENLVKAILYIGGLIFCAMLLPWTVPDFSGVMALPPFFSKKNEEIVQLVSIQVIDRRMVDARERMRKAARVAMVTRRSLKEGGHSHHLRSLDEKSQKSDQLRNLSEKSQKSVQGINKQLSVESGADEFKQQAKLENVAIALFRTGGAPITNDAVPASGNDASSFSHEHAQVEADDEASVGPTGLNQGDGKKLCPQGNVINIGTYSSTRIPLTSIGAGKSRLSDGVGDTTTGADAPTSNGILQPARVVKRSYKRNNKISGATNGTSVSTTIMSLGDLSDCSATQEGDGAPKQVLRKLPFEFVAGTCSSVAPTVQAPASKRAKANKKKAVLKTFLSDLDDSTWMQIESAPDKGDISTSAELFLAEIQVQSPRNGSASKSTGNTTPRTIGSLFGFSASSQAEAALDPRKDPLEALAGTPAKVDHGTEDKVSLLVTQREDGEDGSVARFQKKTYKRSRRGKNSSKDGVGTAVYGKIHMD